MLTATILAAEEAEHSILLPATYDIIWSAVCFVIIAFVLGKLVLLRLAEPLRVVAEVHHGHLRRGDDLDHRV